MTARSPVEPMDLRFRSSPGRWLAVLVLLAVMAVLAMTVGLP